MTKRPLDRWSWAALALMVLALGLPWSSPFSTGALFSPGYYLPSLCYGSTVYGYDGYAYYEPNSYCTLSYLNPGLILPGYTGGGEPGYAGSARVWIAGAMVAVWLSWRLSSHRLRRLAILLVFASVVLHGTEMRAGGIVTLAAGLCLTRVRSANQPQQGNPSLLRR